MIQQLPLLNASLNFLALVFMCVGFVFIRLGRMDLHRKAMFGAVLASSAFLASYLTYHFAGDPRVYTGNWPYFYYGMLVTHIVLAISVPVFVVYLLYKAWFHEYGVHRKVARYALPIWVYVSLTGVLIYFMVHYNAAPA